MIANNIRELALFEHRFWLQILGDHSRFIYNALSPKEKELMSQADQFVSIFDNLLKKARRSISDEELHELNYRAYSAAMKIRKFKLIIISRKIKDKIDIGIAPTFINHMLNELDEYIYILNDLIKNEITLPGDIHLHLHWLSDAEIHALATANGLDMTYKELVKRARTYSKKFANSYLRAIEYKGYTRTGIYDFPALDKLNYDVDELMTSFKNFLKTLEGELLRKEVIGTMNPLMVNHMFREECYYLTKLSMVSKVKEPGCDPTTPRIEI